jgi:hypothetical protein
MELWQMLLILMIGADALIQLLRLNRENANGKKIDALVASLDSEEDAPLVIQNLSKERAQLRGELKWIKDALNNTYGMASGQFTKLEAALLELKPKTKGRKS